METDERTDTLKAAESPVRGKGHPIAALQSWKKLQISWSEYKVLGNNAVGHV